MTNKQLINARWRYTDNQLKKYYKRFGNVFSDIKQELIELFKELGISRPSLNSVVSSKINRKYDRDKRDWKERGIITPYFQFLMDTTTKLTYSNLLKIYVMALYLKYQKKEFDECKNLLVSVANDTYRQAEKELNRKPGKDLTWSMIAGWAIIQTINVPFESYIEILNQTASEEASRIFINTINQDLILEESMLSKMIDKQLHRFISVKDGRYSGLLENTSRQIGNMAYTQPFPNHKVRFVAEMDDRTTKMCMSMNDYIFNTKDRNVFYRYSDAAKSKVKYDIQGLQLGVNLPPIMDHFHYCRSIVSYQTQLTSGEIKMMTRINNIKLKNIRNITLDVVEEEMNAKPVKKATYWDINGTKYPLAKGSVYFNVSEEARNTEIAQWFSKRTGKTIELQPVVINPPHTKTADFITLEDRQKVELKDFDIQNYNASKNYIDSKLSTGYGQANHFILDITNTPFSVEKAVEDLDLSLSYANKSFVDRVYLKYHDMLVGIFERIQ
ncbi:MAG: hypothetical protein IIZ80_04195 [Erysipelotrichaceae bacterium]|nr:hypothetical protein [Erysipelotrichaceae bacterium]